MIQLLLLLLSLNSVTVFAGVLFVHQPGANHAPGASVTQVNSFCLFTKINTFLRIRADPSMQVFWVSVSDSGSLSDTFLMFLDVFSIIIIIIYYIFCCRNRNWDSPDLMQF